MSDRAMTHDEVRAAAVSYLVNLNLHAAIAALDRYAVNPTDATLTLHDVLALMLEGCSVNRCWDDPRAGHGNFSYVIATPYLAAQRKAATDV